MFDEIRAKRDEIYAIARKHKAEKLCKETLCGFFVAVLALFACNAESVPESTKDRIAEIAACLPEAPCADGAHASDRTKWAPIAASEAGKEVVAYAETIAAESVPETPDSLYLEYSKNGNRSNYEECILKRNSNFRWLCLGECLEHKGRFIPKIVEYMDAYCAMKSWTLPAHDGKLNCFNGKPHVDLVSAETSRELAFCLSWLGDEIPEADRKSVV